MSMAPDRFHGSAERARVEDVLAWIDAHVGPLAAEDVLVTEAAGRILAEDARTAMDLPPFDRAAVDGWALRAEATIGANAYNPLAFRLASSVDDLPADSAVRVHAGEPLPRGADAVVCLQHVVPESSGIGAVIEPVAAGHEVERMGSHAARGSMLAKAGRRLRACDVGVLAAAGLMRVAVVRRPRARCLLTGHGVMAAGTPPAPGGVPDADGPLLRALIERDGGVVEEQRRVDRDRTAMTGALASSAPDIILVAGGTGPGADDHAAASLAQAGELVFRGVALRPAETAGVGRTAAGVPVFLLPGAPAACLWAYEFFAGRAIRRLGGRHPELPFRSRRLTAARKIVSEIGTTDVRAIRYLNDAAVEPIASFAEAGLTAATLADGFVVVPENSEGYPQGAVVTVYLYDERSSPHP